METKLNLDEYAIEIIDIFENILEANDIKIPDEMRSGNDDEACLFGNTFLYAKDAVDDVLKKAILQFAINLKISVSGIDEKEIEELEQKRKEELDDLRKLIGQENINIGKLN